MEFWKLELVNTTIYIYLHLNSYFSHHNKDSLFLKMSLVSRKFQRFASRTLSHPSTLILVFRCPLRNPQRLSSPLPTSPLAPFLNIITSRRLLLLFGKGSMTFSFYLQSRLFLHPFRAERHVSCLLKNCKH